RPSSTRNYGVEGMFSRMPDVSDAACGICATRRHLGAPNVVRAFSSLTSARMGTRQSAGGSHFSSASLYTIAFRNNCFRQRLRAERRWACSGHERPSNISRLSENQSQSRQILINRPIPDGISPLLYRLFSIGHPDWGDQGILRFFDESL